MTRLLRSCCVRAPGKLSLGVAGVGGEHESWVYFEHRSKLEGTHAFNCERVRVSLAPVGIPVMTGVRKNVVAPTVMLNVSELQCFWICPISWESSFLGDPVIL